MGSARALVSADHLALRRYGVDARQAWDFILSVGGFGRRPALLELTAVTSATARPEMVTDLAPDGLDIEIEVG